MTTNEIPSLRDANTWATLVDQIEEATQDLCPTCRLPIEVVDDSIEPVGNHPTETTIAYYLACGHTL